MNQAVLEAQAEALRLANSAKYKAEGMTHRAEVKTRTRAGFTKQVHVVYFKTDKPLGVKTIALCRKFGACISDVSITAL